MHKLDLLFERHSPSLLGLSMLSVEVVLSGVRIHFESLHSILVLVIDYLLEVGYLIHSLRIN